jgi:hypothetical protein
LEHQMEMHRMADCLRGCEELINLYPALLEAKHQMQCLDSQMVEMQQGGERQCRQLYTGAIPFSEQIRIVHPSTMCVSGLSKGCELVSPTE